MLVILYLGIYFKRKKLKADNRKRAKKRKKKPPVENQILRSLKEH